MKASEIDTFISSLIDDLEDTAHSDGAELGRLLTYPEPVVDDAELLATLVTASRLRNVADALLTRVAGAAESAGVAVRKRDTAANMLVSLGIPPFVASRLMKVARTLRLLPGLASTTRDARLSGEHAAAVVTGLAHITNRVKDLDSDERAALVSNLIAQAVSGTPNDVTTWARKTALELVPESVPASIAEDRELNELSLSTGDDGRTHAELDLDVLAGEKFRVALDPLTTPVPQPDGSADPRSARQRRADAFEQILDTYLRGEDRPYSGGQLPHVAVTIPKGGCAQHYSTDADGEADIAISGREGTSSVATGEKSQAPASTSAQVPSLDFGQPISPQTAEIVACDCEFTAMILDAEGVPLDIKKTQRLFPPELRRALIIRDKGCSFPGCGKPPSWCQAHHLRYWSQGGETTIGNGALLCQRHHTIIHHTEWEMRMGSDGHPWFSSPPISPGAQRSWMRSQARRTLTIDSTAAA
ncbi:hypothetical protein GOEFS_075_00270 [Gordonia effusa NBRC 100432]|uniref:HNH nuclease domain-containing protein n=1 Tax=Gordonia effusa NBRC 100432 TaxID=1077974 RepID=H0R201_9ACTN|nr:HNH endonuclease signature motif containing protein [Gordonia effusa]GAB19106.1 hypothetical protein GOEFS_075_00270 [Gordonia effusa NBRC 100432]